ncbi:hypothetical protein [Aeoliella mucimassa]|uniref:Secreted protein n=1 Tax=Aeoliella mucimassa TaxID=2527972 RepID=A0A518AN32_9BACT|nr:hypothetical protein [Aeoliella mucimassa]QDU56123.1 hypothetical protein Pan181_23270 [Aeoliella mucimassa]
MVRSLSAWLFVLAITASAVASAAEPPADDTLLTIDNGTTKIGIDRSRGGSITWLSWSTYPHNTINIHDPGRLIQQSYYTGRVLDRTAEGQSKSWSPWPWNPIQGGGVSSWARVTRFEKPNASTLTSVTIPKLWDMPDEEAAAVMHQTTRFEPDMPEVMVIENRLECRRSSDDAWGPAVHCSQEVPACYFTRNFDHYKSYLGDGEWRDEHQPAGPPWGNAEPPRKAMACFNAEGQGIAVFSPTSNFRWNFGPHQEIMSDDPEHGACVHVAPISQVTLGPKSTYEYRYWLVVGDQATLADRLETLWAKYKDEQGTLTNPSE